MKPKSSEIAELIREAATMARKRGRKWPEGPVKPAVTCERARRLRGRGEAQRG